MRILYFGHYDPEYPRNKTLIKGLRANGAEVLEINSRAKSFLKYFKLLFFYLSKHYQYDAMVVGFPGQESMFLAGCLKAFRLAQGKPIIFDTFTSHYGGHILDRGKHGENSLRAKWYKWIDRQSVKLADLALLDTNAHVNFFVSEFGLPREKFRRILVGTDSYVFYPRSAVGFGEASPREIQKNTNNFLVHFQGNYIPLQGVEYIIQAAKLLEGENIVFNLLGRGQTYQKNLGLAKKLEIKNINFIDRVPYEKLADYINMADISLGIFGDTLKTQLVIPNKVFESIACAKPVITADTPAIKELFTDGENMIFCQPANPEDLAKKILKLKNDAMLRQQIAQSGYRIFKEKCTEKILGGQLINIIKETL